MRVNTDRSFAIFPFIFISKSVKDKWVKCEIAHENVHRVQQFLWLVFGVITGWVIDNSILWASLGGLVGEGLWFACYFVGVKFPPLRKFSAWFRWIMERPAWRRQLKAQIKAGRKPNIRVLITVLTTQYWDMADKQQARKFLQSL